MTRFRDLLAASARPVGTFVKLPAVESVELMALGGFDFVVLDLEHSPMSLETASALAAVARGRRVHAFVRVPDHAPIWIQRCLDIGVTGVVVPHVDNVDQARVVGRAARFEPRGTRGMGPTSRAGDWGLSARSAYVDQQGEVMVIVQIESRAGVDNAAAIAAEDTVDGLLVGPVDLGQALGVTPDSEELVQAIKEVSVAARRAGKPAGIAIGAQPQQAADLAAAEFDFTMTSNDATLLGASAVALVDEYRRALAGTTSPRVG